jgi:hypothetical protein
MRFAVSSLIALAVSGSALAEPAAHPGTREPFGRAHVQMMARVQRGAAPGIMADVDLWAEGTRLRATIAGDGEHAQYWIDGLASEPLRIVKGQVAPAKAKTLAQGVEFSLRAPSDAGNRQNDRVAGKPCKIVSERLKGGLSLRRCFWRGLPLSIELKGRGFEFNAAATLVEEKVALADLQPPVGAPAAPRSMNAAR